MPKPVRNGELANANNSVLAFRLSSNGRPGYFPLLSCATLGVPPHDGIWHASKGAGMIPWNSPNPPRNTTFFFVPTLYATPRRGSKFFHCVFSALDGQVSHSQRIPPFSVRFAVARHLSWT